MPKDNMTTFGGYKEENGAILNLAKGVANTVTSAYTIPTGIVGAIIGSVTPGKL